MHFRSNSNSSGLSRRVRRHKTSAQTQQYLKAVTMSSAELGAAIKTPTELIAKHVGNAIAHHEQAKREREAARREFTANIAYYYEVKQRLLNPGYRSDLDGGDRTLDDNQRYFGAQDWATFNVNCAAYSLQHADRKLRQFARKNGLLPEDELGSDAPEGPKPHQNDDPTPQKRYEFIAEHEPAPLMPVAPDVYTEVFSFITKVSSLVTDEGVRSEARRLIGKMLLHRPVPDATEILSDATEQEARKRNKRLVNNNGQALGSEDYNPPTTCEHVQRFNAEAQGDSAVTDESAPAIEPDSADVLVTVVPAANAPTGASAESHADARKPVASVKVTEYPPMYEAEGEGNCERNLGEPSFFTPPDYVGCEDVNSVADSNIEDSTDEGDSEGEEPPCAGGMLHPCWPDDWIRCNNCHEMLCMEHGNPHAVCRPARPSAAPDFLCDDCAEAAESRGEIQPTDDGYEYADYDVA